MPALPTYTQQTRATGPLGPGPSSTATDAGQLVNAALQAAQKIEVSKNAWELADATAKSLGELEQYKGELDSDADFDTHSSRYVAKAKEIEQRYTQSFGGTATGRVWREDFRRAAQSGSLEVAARAQVLKAQKVRADLGNTLFDQSQLIGINPQMDEALRSQAKLAIDTSASAGNITPAERLAMYNKFDSDASEAMIRRDMLADPEGAEIKLATGAYPRLSAEAQAIWAQRLSDRSYTEQQRRLAQESHDYTVAERAKKEAEEGAAKKGDELLRSGGLTPTWLAQNREALNEADYRYFSRAMNGGDDVLHDPLLYADLRDRAGRGEDVRGEARDALRSTRIRPSDYDRIVGEVESERPGWYARGKEYIKTMAAVSQLNPDPAAAQNLGGMINQWDDWVHAHPKASDVEAIRASQDIVSSNALVKISGLPLMKYMKGTRFEPDLQATALATQKAFKDGEINKDEYARQAQLLKQWREALQAQSGPTTPAGTK